VLADPKAVYRILDNLLSNAIKYSPPGRDVFIRIRNLPDGVIWEVQDQGAGLTEADQAKLFQKFTKLSARPTGGESSTGLGLSIVKMLAQQMNGSVECRSKAGEGATFAVRLPEAEAAGAAQ
jgi:signal transduction histidine kinase